MTMHPFITRPLTYVAWKAMWDSPWSEATLVASLRGNVKALDRRHAG
jgi:hypothetical protein